MQYAVYVMAWHGGGMALEEEQGLNTTRAKGKLFSATNDGQLGCCVEQENVGFRKKELLFLFYKL